MKFCLKSIIVLTLLSVFFAAGAGAGEKKPALPKLMDLGAHKCASCKKMEPVLDELAQEYQDLFEVEFVDVVRKENRARVKEHKVRMIPTQIFFDAEGRELWRHVGFFSKMDILRKWRKLGYDFKIPAVSGRRE